MPPEAASLLVVDDNPADRALLRHFLTPHGFDLVDALDGPSALAMLQQRPFDLVLLDVEMPGTNGFDVLRAIREKHAPADLPVMMATVKDSTTDIVEALRLGANDYVTKPFDLPVVLARVQTQHSLKSAIDRGRELEQSLAQRNKELEQANRRMRKDLEAAARVQWTLLPSSMPHVGGVEFAWHYRPCTELAGDLLGLVGLGGGRACLYVLDVVGHGVKAALLAVMIHRVLSGLLESEQALSPTSIACELNKEFPWDQRTEQFFSLMIGILDRPAGEFRFVSAGQPGPIRISPTAPPSVVRADGPLIGVGDGLYEEQRLTFSAGDRLFLFTDGLTETISAEGVLFGEDRCACTLADNHAKPLAECVKTLIERVESWSAPKQPHDDITVVAVEIT